MIDDKTQHGLDTSYSLSTEHKLPYSVFQPDDANQIIELFNLVNQLYPTGRAWYGTEGGVFDNLHGALNVSFLRVIESYKALINSSIPDNNNFSTDDAKFLEYKYGLITNESVSLTLRRSALARKIGHPNDIKARQSKSFIENQLRLAGFDVTVYENTLPYRTPQEIAGLVIEETQHGDNTQHSDSTYHGSVTFDVIANKIQPGESYGVGTNLWASFFIGGDTLGDVAIIPLERQREFRELVLKLKPAHLAAYIFINFV
jgi:hypothetical protein